MSDNTLIRHGAPTKYDHAPQGTKCIVMVNNQESEVYIQTSSDEANPLWVVVEYYDT